MFRGFRSKNTEANSLSLQPDVAVEVALEEADSPVVDIDALHRDLHGHKRDIPNIVSRMFVGYHPDAAEVYVEGLASKIVEDLTGVINNWQKRTIRTLHTAKTTIENEMPKWQPMTKMADRFKSEVENQASVLRESLKQIFEQKARKAIQAHEVSKDLAKVHTDRTHMLIRLLGDEKAELRMMDVRWFAVASIIGVGIITIIEAMLGMPIFRFESSSGSGYWFSLAFAWTLSGFTMVGAHFMHRLLAAKEAHVNYEHTYDKNHLPEDEQGRIIKPLVVHQRDKILAWVGTGGLILIAITLLTWRVMVSYGMASDGGLGFMGAFLLLAVSALLYLGHLVFGPKFALADYRKYESFEKREAELQNKFNSLMDEEVITQQIQFAMHRYISETDLSEKQIMAEAEWIIKERDSFCDNIHKVKTQLDQADKILDRDFVTINELIQRDPLLRISPSVIQDVLNQERWQEELKQSLLPIEVDDHTLDRFRQFKPNYNLDKDILLTNFTDLLASAEKESVEKVHQEVALQRDSNGIVPLKLNLNRRVNQ